MSTHTILIVDDSVMSRMLLSAISADVYPEAEIIEACDAEEALKCVAGRSVDIAAVDLNMPGMDGLTLSRKLLALFPGLKIGLLTATAPEEILQQVASLDICFVPKPITEENLRAFLEE